MTLTTLIYLLIAAGVILVWLSWIAGPDTVFRMIYYNDTHITDYKLFPGRALHPSPQPASLKEGSVPSSRLREIQFGRSKTNLDELLSSNATVQFIVLKDGIVQYENYFNGYDESSLVQCFSMSKSFLSVLIGCAIDDGYIPSENVPVTNYIPEMEANGWGSVTIKHLLQMRSGSNYRQGGLAEINPFGHHPRFEYTPRLEKEIVKLKVVDPPGASFVYKSGDTAILSLILKRALKTETITDYMQRRVWTPLGMEANGMYTIDHAGDGLEKTWCCLAATARDFAKVGLLYLNGGKWGDTQIVSQAWVERSTREEQVGGRYPYGLTGYGYQWWLGPPETGDFFALGKAGQFLYVNPIDRVVIVRLGKNSGSYGLSDWLALFRLLSKTAAQTSDVDAR